MKKAMSFGVTLSLFFVLLVSYTFAQDYTQWGLPEGAKARLGKGNITGNIAYSPDGTRLAVASSIGIWLYDTGSYQEVALLTRHSSYQARYTGDVASVAFSPDGLTLASGGAHWRSYGASMGRSDRRAQSRADRAWEQCHKRSI